MSDLDDEDGEDENLMTVEIDEEDFADADYYAISVCVKEKFLRLQFFDEDRNLLSSFEMPSEDAYEMAQCLLKSYDELEGL